MIRITKNNRKDRSFGLALSIMCVGFCAYRYVQGNGLNYTVAGIGLFLLVVALSAPLFLYPFRVSMEFLGHYMGIANTFILLTIVFILLIMPIGLILKLTGKDNLNRKWDLQTPSYWVKWPESGSRSMKNQF